MPFSTDHLNTIVNAISAVSLAHEAEIASRLEKQQLVHSDSSVHHLAAKLAGIYKSMKPAIQAKALACFLGDHGIADIGASSISAKALSKQLEQWLSGNGELRYLANRLKARSIFVDVGLSFDLKTQHKILRRKSGKATLNLLQEPAMTRDQLERNILVGAEVALQFIERKVNLLCLSTAGRGSTSAAVCICAKLFDIDSDLLSGRGGSQLEDVALTTKRLAIAEALKRYKRLDKNDSLSVLETFGGFEIAAAVGFLLAASYKAVPVVVDGLPAVAAALIASRLQERVRGYVFASCLSDEPALTFLVKELELPLILHHRPSYSPAIAALLALPVLETAAQTAYMAGRDW